MEEKDKAQLENLVGIELEKKINDVFIFSHQFAGTKTGDITPHQQLNLDYLTNALKELIIKQTLQNL